MHRREFLKTTAAAAVAVGSVNLFNIGRARAATGEINLYSSRHYSTDEALYSDFTAQSGIKINRIEAGADALLERLQAEGANSPADVLITVDAGRLVRAQDMGLLQKVDSEALNSRIPGHLRDPDGTWYGFSTRARVIMYNKDKVGADDISTYEELADPKWKGRFLTRSSTNIYSQSWTGSILAAHGEEITLEWAKGIVANLARDPRGGDTDQIRATAAGEGDLCIANTYYLGNLRGSAKAEDNEVAAKIGVVFPNQENRGTHVNISGAGVLASAPNAEGAKLFLEYLASEPAQKYFADGNNEYPVVAGVAPPSTIEDLGEFKQDQLNASVFARNNAEALKIMDLAGWK